VTAASSFGPDEIRSRVPRFSSDNLAENQPLLEHVQALARERGATAAQVALAWLLAREPWIVPIPGARRRERIDENVGATAVGLSADDVAGLDSLVERLGVAGNRYDDAGMRMVGR